MYIMWVECTNIGGKYPLRGLQTEKKRRGVDRRRCGSGEGYARGSTLHPLAYLHQPAPSPPSSSTSQPSSAVAPRRSIHLSPPPGASPILPAFWRYAWLHCPPCPSLLRFLRLRCCCRRWAVLRWQKVLDWSLVLSFFGHREVLPLHHSNPHRISLSPLLPCWHFYALFPHG